MEETHMKRVVVLAAGAAALAWVLAPVPASADYVASANTAAVCLQTQASGYWRLTSNDFDVRWDWEWEWVPMNATGVTVTVKSDMLGVDFTWSSDDTAVTNVVLTDLFPVGRGMNAGSPVVTLTFANADGWTRSKSRTYDVFAGAFGCTDVRRGPVGSYSWKAIEYPLVIPTDTRWFVNTATSAHLLWTNTASQAVATNSIWRGTGLFVYNQTTKPKAAYTVDLYFWGIAPVNHYASAELDLFRGGTMVIVH
jgi:hypothetical protein